MNTQKHADRIAHYCRLDRTELMDMCDIYFNSEIGGYLGWINRGARILAVAHIDHLGSGIVHTANERVVVSSALDDRLGVYAAIEALPAMGVECDVLLCDDEESANSTMQSIGMRFLQRYNWIVELDCAGVQAITYDYRSMKGVLGTVWPNVNRGAFSDITSVETVSPVGAFNAGVGYHMQHTENCYVKLTEFITAMCKVKKFYDMFKDIKFIESDNMQPSGEPYECIPSYKSYSFKSSWNDNKHYQEYITRRPHDADDPADQLVVRHPDPFLVNDTSPDEIECCEMCARILMDSEVYLYQGFPVCEEHYYMLVADHIDGTPENIDEWEAS